MTYDEQKKLEEAVKLINEADYIIKSLAVPKEVIERLRYKLNLVVHRIETVIEGEDAR